jgi:hypothetical protein
VPTTVQIDLGELAINTRDGKLFLKRDNGNGTFTIIDIGAVLSVAGKTGAVTLAKGDVGLGNADNTSDAEKPISSATQAALNDLVSTGRHIVTGAGLTGGGDLSVNRTINADIATKAEAQAGAASGKLMSALSVEHHMAANAIGWGQGWEQVARSGGVIYPNETGRPILVSYYDTSSTQCFLDVSLAGTIWVRAGVSRYGAGASCIVPAGWRYRFNYTPDYVAILS